MTVMEIRAHLKPFSMEIEKELLLLWDILAKLKNIKVNEVDPNDMVSFQYRLVKVLNDASRYFDLLTNTRKAIEKHKKKIGKEYHKQKAEVDELMAFLKFLLVISRSLGDAFVFMFYSTDRDYLNKHLSHSPQSLILPKGIGGIGEMEFVKNFKVIEGNIVLYHGITNILRIGDFTLFNVHSGKVTAVAELKSYRPDQTSLNMNLTIIGPKERGFNPILKDDTGKAEKQNSPFQVTDKERFEERYKKQVKTMADSFEYLSKKKKGQIPEDHAKLYSKPKWDIMAELAAESVDKMAVYKQIDRGLILSRYAYKGETIFDRFMNYSNRMDKSDEKELTDNFMKIFNPSIDFSVAFGQIHFTSKLRIEPVPGSKPIFWYPIDVEVLKKIYFGEIIFCTMYNVGYLIDEMKKLGYIYEYNEQYKQEGFSKKNSDAIYFISGVPYYIDMITHYLQDESIVIESIEKASKSIYQNLKGNGALHKAEISIIMD